VIKVGIDSDPATLEIGRNGVLSDRGRWRTAVRKRAKGDKS
jgi:hypothetical protein